MDAIKNNKGRWLYDKNEIKNHTVHYFIKSFKSNGREFINYPSSCMFPTVDSDVIREMV